MTESKMRWKRILFGILFIGCLAAALVVGLRKGPPTEPTTQTDSKSPEAVDSGEEKSAVNWWACSMHPEVKQDSPGKCPVCSMNLVSMD